MSHADIDALLGDLLMDDDGTPRGEAAIISNGVPCRCGRGFCASGVNVGYFGYCRGMRHDQPQLPDCPLCGAPHQGPDGCWLCSTCGGNSPREEVAVWIRCLEHGITATDLHRVQDALFPFAGWVSSDAAINLILAVRTTTTLEIP